jgi:glucose/arabinose dehydrogenase
MSGRTALVASAALAALVLAVGACGDDATDEPGTTTTFAPATTEATDPDAPETTEPGEPSEPETVTDLSGAAVTLTPVAELDRPIAVAVRPGSPALYVAERAGRVRLVDPGTGAVDPDPFLDISADTTTSGERGLLGLAFHPDGDRVYLSYTDRDGDTRVDEWALSGDAVVADSRRLVYELAQPFPNHNGGDIGFGPDEMLYLGMGDGGGGGDPLRAGQDPTTPLGALVRIDPSPDGDRAYTIPADNPFTDGGGAPEIWSIGLRNPWRFSWDAATGDLWIADVGQGAVEEVNVVPAPADGSPPGRGANFGWPIFEGDAAYDGGAEPEAYVPPVHTYRHRPGCSVTGGVVSRDARLPGLLGAYLYSDFCDPTLYAVLARDGQLVEARSLEVSVPGGQVVSFGEGPAGELYVLSLAGGLFRLDPA